VTREPDATDQPVPAPAPGEPGEIEESTSLVELVSRVLDRGVVLQGDVTISVAGVDLVYLGLNALLTSISTARRTLQRPVGQSALRPAPGSAQRSAPESLAAAVGSLQPGSGGAPSREPGAAAREAAAEPLAAEIVQLAEGLPRRLEVDPDAVQRDLARLVLTLVELLRRVVEHQAVRRMEDDDLSEEQVERMGTALLRLEEKLAEIKRVFGVADEELNIDLGPLGKLL
jgi:hypothetical protein